MERTWRQVRYWVADFLWDNWPDILSAVGVVIVVIWAVRFEVGPNTVDKALQVAEGIFAIVVIMLVRMMFIGQRLKQVGQDVKITAGDVFGPQLELSENHLMQATQVTLVGRTLSSTIETNFPGLLGLLRGDVAITIAITNPEHQPVLEQLEAAYCNQFTAEEHAARLRAVTANVKAIARAGEGNELELRFLDIVTEVGGYVIRKPKRRSIVGIEFYLVGDEHASVG